MAWPRILSSGGLNTSLANQPNGYVGIDLNGVANVNLIPRSGTWASLFALDGGASEPGDGEILFVTDVAGGTVARWDATAGVPVFYSRTIKDYVVGYWGFHEGGTGGNSLDLSGNQSTLVSSGSPTSQTGVCGSRRVFASASSQYFSVANNANIHLGDIPFFIMGLFSVTSLASLFQLMGQQTGDANTATYFQVDNGTGQTYFVSGSGGTLAVATGAVVATGVDYFLAAYHNPATNLIGYSITALTAATPVAYTTAAQTNGLYASNSSWAFGVNLLGPSQYLNGTLEEVVFLKYYIPTAAELESIFQKAKLGRPLV